MNELQIIVNQQQGTITTNFAELEESLAEQMQIYKELEVTEANKPERKKDIATLRKIQKAITEKKSEVRNFCLKPYEEFNERANALAGIIQEPIRIIDSQVKEFEDKQRLQKIEDIKTAFGEMMENYPTLSDDIGIAEIYDNRWENISTTPKSIKDEMTTKLNTIRDNVALISSMVSDKTEEALSLFWGDLDVAKAMQMINRYEAQKREIQVRLEEQQRKDKEAEEERQRLARERELEREKQKVRDEEMARIQKEEQIREEERRKAAEAEERIREEERSATEKRLMEAKAPDPVDDLEAPFDIAGNEIRTTFIVEGTPEELEQVAMYLNSIGLVWERKDV